ncbi:hypothetical protein O181_056265 [Austropuccinia psidii MF-1]|uniref:Uncharacterized protein n=1 Tax=Austropuccinia psidii MF-1 TaxID=1389203 RepID=A0A9Q3HVY8_9BASI|nr:hypothetical protein [Austropuccinia psidii MF-1]
MEGFRPSTSSQRLVRNFKTLLESPEAEMTAIPVVRSEQLPTSRSRNISVSVQELVDGSKAEGEGATFQVVDRENELLPSSKEALGPRKDTRPSERLDTHFLKEKGPKDEGFVGIPYHFFRGSEERVFTKQEQQPCGSSPSVHRQESTSISPKTGNKSPNRNQKGKGKSHEKRPYPQSHRISKKENTAMHNVFNMARALMEFKNNEEEMMNQYLPKK